MTDVLQIIGEKLGRCVEFKRSQFRGMGIRLANGSWIGVLGLVHKKEVDFSGSIMAINDERVRTFDYSTTIFMDDRILVHKWPGIQPTIDGLFKPFTPETGRHQQVPSSRLPAYSWNPTGNSVRVMTCLWLLMSLVINTVYRSNLMSMLILPKVQLPFDSLEELIQSGIKTFVPLQSIMYNAMMAAPVGAPLNRLRAQALFHYDTQKATRDILDGKCAGFVGQASFRYVMHKVFKMTGKCPDIYMASEIFFGGNPCSMAFPKGSPLLRKINPMLTRLKEHGILSFMYNTAIAHSIHCSKLQVGNTSRALELRDFYGVFLIYIAGEFWVMSESYASHEWVLFRVILMRVKDEMYFK
ncbi:uncharacterized protein [Macrobrachium rosenbergii]|uniref:uncharacterized protein n=1 Tax=Macrobrachium rosenbergii TaxID=79674 RepID=UPI0034D3EA59